MPTVVALTHRPVADGPAAHLREGHGVDTRDLTGRRPIGRRTIRGAAALALALAVAACGGDGTNEAAEDVSSPDADVETAADDPSDEEAASSDESDEGDDGEAATDASANDASDDSASAAGGGGAAIAIGDETWSFTGVECYFADDLEGDEEFVLLATRDGIMLYVSIDGDGHYLELSDLDQPDDPRVDWYTMPDAAEFITMSGTGVVANTPVTGFDDAGATLQADARLTASCPD
jgi:hypothetical protein